LCTFFFSNKNKKIPAVEKAAGKFFLERKYGIIHKRTSTFNILISDFYVKKKQKKPSHGGVKAMRREI